MTAHPDDVIADAAIQYRHDPQGWAAYAWDWGQGALSAHAGPRAWQADINRRVREHMTDPATRCQPLRIAVASGHGIGKALAHGEPVLTPLGWRAIEGLRVGEEVISCDGTATRVRAVYPQGERDLYRVTLDDGCSVVVDGEHQWLTTTRSERKHGKPGKVRTTLQIAESLTFPNGPLRGLNHRLPSLGAVRHPRAALPLDPYVLGAWLGDGDGVGRVTGMADKLDVQQAAGAEFGVASRKQGTDAVTRTLLGARPALRALGLFGCRSHEKFVPTVYLHASIEQRIALLQGLLDTDGSANGDGAVTFEVTSRALADGCAELVRSLGGVVRRSEKDGAYRGKVCRRVYRLYLALPPSVNPFRLSRKAGRYAPQWGERNCERTRERFIAAVEPVGRGLATCIAVEHQSHLFVTRDHIVTHNSAEVGMMLHWAMSTCDRTRVVVTANTETQLRTKTWPEVAKWFNSSINAHWWKVPALSLYQVDAEKEWRADAIAWSATNTEGFAGLHNEGRRIVVIFDEASGIDDKVWEVTEGALTDENTEILWFAFGNPTRPTGRFRECFGKYRHQWQTLHIDSRTVEGTNKEYLQGLVDTYGEDSDVVRVRVRGVFPSQAVAQFIPTALVEEAMRRKVDEDRGAPLILGADIARFGDDESVLRFRRGRDGAQRPPIKWRNRDTHFTARRIATTVDEHNPDAVFVDGGGVGAGVVDNLKAWRYRVHEVAFGGKANDAKVYANKRAEMWGLLKAWLATGALDPDPKLLDDLTAPEYHFDRDGRIVLESKQDMKDRGLASPDDGDALATTFAEPVARKDIPAGVGARSAAAVTDYDEFA